MKILPVGAEVFFPPCGRAEETHDEANSRIWQFCDCVEKGNLHLYIIRINANLQMVK